MAATGVRYTQALTHVLSQPVLEPLAAAWVYGGQPRTRLRAGLLPKAINYDGGPMWRMLLPHIDALASHAPPGAGTETTAFLLNQAGVLRGRP